MMSKAIPGKTQRKAFIRAERIIINTMYPGFVYVYAVRIPAIVTDENIFTGISKKQFYGILAQVLSCAGVWELQRIQS